MAIENVEKYFALIKHDFEVLDILSYKSPDHLKDVDFSDWQVTLLFYMACIYIKAVLIFDGKDIQNHFSLRQEISSHDELKTVYKKYRELEEASRDARYEGRVFDKNHIVKILLPKFILVRDCAVNFLEKKGIKNIPKVSPANLFNRPK